MAKAEQPQQAVQPDLLKRISAKARELRDTKHEIENVEERLKQLNMLAFDIERQQLPELLSEAGVDRLSIPAEGNEPAYDLKLEPFYRASISAEWDQEKRKSAFAYLEQKGAADLIKTEVTVALPRELREKAPNLIKKIESALKALKATASAIDVKENVHWATLTSWLREVSEAGEDVDLEKIGGQAGSIVKQKPRKSK
jgi:hypothetical protein